MNTSFFGFCVHFISFAFTVNTTYCNFVFAMNTFIKGEFMAKQSTFSIRLDDETAAMLNELDNIYKKEAENFGVNSVSKNQIVNDAIRAYYSQKLNLSGHSENGYLDLMRDSIQQVVEPMLQGSTKFLKEQNEQIIDLAEQALMGMVKLSLQEKLSLYAQKCDTVSKEEIIGFLKSNYSYTEAINEYALSLINGENQENSENE